MDFMKPYYKDKYCIIYHGDCREILPQIINDDINLVLTDPPYGINLNTKRKHWDGSVLKWDAITNDDAEFDPHFLLGFNNIILWGANFYTRYLPIGGWIVWDKRVNINCDKMLGMPFELAWCNNKKCFEFIRLQHGGVINADSRKGNNSKRWHPTQKPILLMKCCMKLVKRINTILDPYMGSGTVLKAAKDLGYKSIGIEIEEKYCEIAIKRIKHRELSLFKV